MADKKEKAPKNPLEVSQGVINLVAAIKDAGNADLTVHDYAEKLGVKYQAVTGYMNVLTRGGFGIREEATVIINDKETSVKFLKLTPAGMDAAFFVKA